MEKKESYLISKVKSKCTGCMSCVQACPKKCISMVEDVEGFLYPCIDKTKCIDCNKCNNVCPVINNVLTYNKLEIEKIYAYVSNDLNNLLSSSSGGAFYDIASAFCSNCKNIAIFGAKFDKNLKVVHDYVTSIEDIGVFKKSKYVQSYIGNSYVKVRDFLNKKYRVIFSGTPCQIAGLKNFLNKDYEDLLCVDIVCHGVPNQYLFDMSLLLKEKEFHSKISEVNFREKVIDRFGKYSSKNIKYLFDNGNTVVENSNENAYLKGFQSSLFYRPSCYECKFASVDRNSDITIADCWGIESVIKDIDFHKGCSAIVLHSIKGLNVFDGIGLNVIKELSLDFIVENNSQYSYPVKYNKKRDVFFKNLNKDNFEHKVFKCTKISFFRRVINKIIRVINKK